MLEWLFPESKIVTKKHQRKRDTEPETKQGNHRGEWYGSAGVFTPDKEVQEETSAEYDSCKIILHI